MKANLKYLLLNSWITGMLLCACQHKDPKPRSIQEAIDNTIRPYVTLGADVGIIVGVIKDGQRSVYSYGEKKLGEREKLSSQSVLEIASLTKVYTALVLAEMHLRGIVNIDDPVDLYLQGKFKIPDFNGKKITLRHLADHTSGLPTYPGNMDMEAYNMYKGYTEQKMIDFLNTYQLIREPGSQEEYSNTGYGLLGYVLGVINKSSYEEVVISYVLKPLQMWHTSVSFTPDQLVNYVQGHFGNKPVESWSKHQQEIMQGVGSLISSMDDQLIFLETNLGLRSSSLYQAMLFTQQVSFVKMGLYANGNCLGWTHYTLNNHEIVWKNGGNGAYSSFMGMNKDAKNGVIILVNSSLNPEAFSTFSGFKLLEALQEF